MPISHATLIALIGLLITTVVATVTVIRFLADMRKELVDRVREDEHRYNDHETRIKLLEQIVEQLSKLVDKPSNKSHW